MCYTYPPLGTASDGIPISWPDYSSVVAEKKARWNRSDVQSKLGLDGELSEAEYEELWEDLQSRTGYFSSLPISIDESSVAPDPTDANESSGYVVDCNLYQWDWSLFDEESCTGLLRTKWNPNYFQCLTFAIPPAYNQVRTNLSEPILLSQ